MANPHDGIKIGYHTWVYCDELICPFCGENAVWEAEHKFYNVCDACDDGRIFMLELGYEKIRPTTRQKLKQAREARGYQEERDSERKRDSGTGL